MAKHDELNKDLWGEDKELLPEVREKIEKIVDNFKDNLLDDEIDLDIKDIVIIGSNANYNYNDTSDIDVHIVADMSTYDNYEDIALKLYQACKSLWNNKYDPLIRGHEVELYVEPDAIHANSNGMYSLNTGWVKEPIKDDIPDIDVEDDFKPYKERFDQIIKQPSVEEIDKLIDDLYLLRQQSILKDGEYGKGNLVFKKFRSEGYMDKLKELKVNLENKEMSIESLQEDISNEVTRKDVYNIVSDFLDTCNLIDYDVVGDTFIINLNDEALSLCDNTDVKDKLIDIEFGIDLHDFNDEGKHIVSASCVQIGGDSDFIFEEFFNQDGTSNEDQKQSLIDNLENIFSDDAIEDRIISENNKWKGEGEY